MAKRAKRTVGKKRGTSAEIDGCDVPFHDEDATPDSELPTATGGMAIGPPAALADLDRDGCDVDFAAADLTADDELPVAIGGSA